MLKSKIAMALAAAMVMAALYGCSSSSDSGLKNDLNTAEGNVTALQGTIDAIAGALGLDPGSDQAAIMAALATATADQLVDVRAALDLATNADSAAIVAAVEALQAGPSAAEDEKAAKVVGPAILASEMNMAGDMRDQDDTRMHVDGLSVTDAGDNGTINSSDTAEDADKKLKMSDTMAVAVSGFDGGVFAQDNSTKTKAATVVDTVYVYTDQEPKRDKEYSMYFTSTTVSEMTAGANEGVSAVVTVADKLDALTLSAMATAHPMSASLPAANLSFATYEDDEDTLTENEASFAGSFRGVGGKFACVAGQETCRAERDKDGKVSLSGGGAWTFTPTEPAAGAKVMVAGVIRDSDYLTFGFWLRETTARDGKVTAMIETLYGVAADGAYPVATAAGLAGKDLEGAATYSGGSTGKYIKKEFTAGGDATVVAGGQFTATANLTASFGTPDTVAVASQNTVNGTISNFMDGDGNEIDDSWTLTLKAAGFGAPNDDLDGENFTGATEGDKGEDAGFWEGTFAGKTMKAAPTDEDETLMAAIRPSGIVGEFNGHFTNGHVVGAFGATEDK